MTKEVYEELQRFEKQIRGAQRNNYARFAHKDFLDFDKVVEKWRGTPLTKNEKGCSRCLLTTLKKIGGEYDDYERNRAARAARAAAKKETDKEAASKEEQGAPTGDES